MTKKNLIDITNVTDRVLDIFMDSKADPEAPVICDGLTVTEKSQLAGLMGWEETMNPGSLFLWIHAPEVDPAKKVSDLEGKILKAF